MSWRLKRSDAGETCVVGDDGSPAGCHETREAAENQVRALFAAEANELADAAIRDALGEAAGVTPETVEFAHIETATSPTEDDGLS